MPGMLVKSLVLLAVATSTVLASVVPTKLHLLPRGTTSQPGDPNSNVLRSVGLPSNNKRVTNAERFARGLPPSKPNRLFDPTRRQSGGASPSPTSTGVIEIFGSGGLLGYVDENRESVYGYTTSEAQALQVAVVLDSPASNIVTLNGNFPHNSYLSLVTYAGSPTDLSSDSGSAYASLDGSTIALPAGSNGDDETAVWDVDSTNGNAITAEWSNSDGTQIPCQFVYGQSAISCTGNAADFISTYGSDYQEVTLAFLST